MKFSEWLVKNGYSTSTFAKAVDIDYATIAVWRRKETAVPRQIYLDKIIAKGFNDCPLLVRKHNA
jgi:hypothetical protein